MAKYYKNRSQGFCRVTIVKIYGPLFQFIHTTCNKLVLNLYSALVNITIVLNGIAAAIQKLSIIAVIHHGNQEFHQRG